MFENFIITIRFIRYNYDPYVYIKVGYENSKVFHLLYVDDILITSVNMKEIKNLKLELTNKFEMKYLGAAKKILGMRLTDIKYLREVITVSI